MLNSVDLAVFAGRLSAICEEMGFILQRSALSPNIKDRLDFSCAYFDRLGKMCAQAAHIPVHLGSMAYAMQGIVENFEWNEGDMVVLNDPFMGGTHLPDVTLLAPFFHAGKHLGFVANRAHHANIGAESAGSMPLSSSLEEEGVLISPVKLRERGEWVDEVVARLSCIEREPTGKLPGDFLAQVSANQTGLVRLQAWLEESRERAAFFEHGLQSLNQYGAELAAQALQRIPFGTARYDDVMDDDGFGAVDLPISVEIVHDESGLSFDFFGTAEQVEGNINCPASVTAAAVYYAVLSLLPDYIPHCAGVFEQIQFSIPKNSLLNAAPGKAVAAGNVETSMRIVDVVLGALSQLGGEVPADSQGTMNNVAMGGEWQGRRWDYYETMGGGMGAGARGDGLDAVQCHMTNTLNTPVESLEMHYPLRFIQYALRPDSGGEGRFNGGAGLIRELEFLAPAEVTVLSERRRHAPRGRHGGSEAKKGQNYLNGKALPAKFCASANMGDRLRIESPGGGGWGNGSGAGEAS